MKKFVKKALKKLLHVPPKRHQHAPHEWIHKKYGNTRQYATPIDISLPLDKSDIKYVQRVVGSFLIYRRAVDNIAITALNNLAMKIITLLDYFYTHPNA